MAPYANDPIMLRRSIRSFRHLEHQNMSIISGDIGRARSVQQFRNGTERRNGRTERSTVVLDNRITTTTSLDEPTFNLNDNYTIINTSFDEGKTILNCKSITPTSNYNLKTITGDRPSRSAFIPQAIAAI